MSVLDWVQTVLIVLLQVAMCAMFYFEGQLAGIRRVRDKALRGFIELRFRDVLTQRDWEAEGGFCLEQ